MYPAEHGSVGYGGIARNRRPACGRVRRGSPETGDPLAIASRADIVSAGKTQSGSVAAFRSSGLKGTLLMDKLTQHRPFEDGYVGLCA